MSQQPIFILGIHQRSGTNYVARLLAAHPDCAQARGEDFFVEKSASLDQFFRGLYGAWPVRADFDSERRAILRHLGDGLLAYLRESIPEGQRAGEDAEKRLVAKTPSVEGLERFFDLFPGAYLLILVRDGRALVESHTRTFHSNWEAMTRRWRAAARRILEFDGANRDRGLRYRLVRYEDLYGAGLQETLDELLDFLELDRARYPFEELDELPVIGSSETADQGSVSWEPQERAESFNPLERWAHWSEARRKRFDYLARDELVAFGYEPSLSAASSAAERAAQLGADARWGVRAAVVGALSRGALYHVARDAYDRLRSRKRVRFDP